MFEIQLFFEAFYNKHSDFITSIMTFSSLVLLNRDFTFKKHTFL